MGLQHSSAPIVTNGLVMNLDASNPRSVVTQNLLKYSQEFSNTTWIKNPGLLIGSTNETAPDGTNTASVLRSIPTPGTIAFRIMYGDYIAQQSYTFSNTTYTFSVYVKNINLTNVNPNVALTVDNVNFGGSQRTVASNFNVNNNSFGGVGADAPWTSGGTTVTSVGNGWYRISITANTTASTYSTFRCGIWLSGYRGTDVTEELGSVALWGAQLEASTSVGTYRATKETPIETTWNDLTGNNNNAYPTSIAGYGGPVTYNSTGFFDFSMNSPASNGGGQGAYNGNGFIMAANNNVVPLTGSFTLNAVIRRNLSVKGAGDRETIFSNGQGGDGWRFGIDTGGSGILYYLIGGANGVGYQEGGFGSINNLTNGNWHMMTIVFDRGAQLGSYSIIGYVDGALSGTVPITSGASGNVAFSNLLLTPGIGYAGCCDVFAGQIAVVQAYNKALTSTEVTQNFNALRGRYGI
jgi:hypothetical protein